MQARDGVFLEDLCPKLRARQWRRTLHALTDHRCLYCGAPSESIDHVFPRSRGGLSSDENCVPACLHCNGDKGDSEVFHWYRSQTFYDPRRAMALRAWVEGDRPLAQRLLSWAAPQQDSPDRAERFTAAAGGAGTGSGEAGRSDRMRSRNSSGDPARRSPRSGRQETGTATTAIRADLSQADLNPSDLNPAGSALAAGAPEAPDAAGRRDELAGRGTTAGPGSRNRRAAERKARRPGSSRPERDRTGIAAGLAGPIATAIPQPPRDPRPHHQTRQAATPLWRWQMAS